MYRHPKKITASTKSERISEIEERTIMYQLISTLDREKFNQ